MLRAQRVRIQGWDELWPRLPTRARTLDHRSSRRRVPFPGELMLSAWTPNMSSDDGTAEIIRTGRQHDHLPLDSSDTSLKLRSMGVSH
jgi:hypothetical protein